MLTQAELKQLLHYDPETGLFTWITTGTGRKRNKSAGWLQRDGYRRIGIHGATYLEHRLAWLYVHGNFPPEQLDHINRTRHDNRITNLRTVSRQQNAFNLSLYKNNKSGYIGVHWRKDMNEYRACIRIDGKLKTIGYYACPKQAHEAYLKVKAELHII